MKLWAAFGLFLLACQGSAPARGHGGGVRAQLGVFFGGQIQERAQATLELDPVRQALGFRLSFDEPLPEPTLVRWEVDVPPSRATQHKRVVRLGRAEAPRGQQIFDQPIALEPGDPAGLWNFRCFVGEQMVVDRAIELMSPQ